MTKISHEQHISGRALFVTRHQRFTSTPLGLDCRVEKKTCWWQLVEEASNWPYLSNRWRNENNNVRFVVGIGTTNTVHFGNAVMAKWLTDSIKHSWSDLYTHQTIWQHRHKLTSMPYGLMETWACSAVSTHMTCSLCVPTYICKPSQHAPMH